MICSRCGFNNKEESRFCRKCGERLIYATPGGTAIGSTLGEGSLLQGRYKIIKQLGKGGMGVVYLTKDNRFSNRLCVVKEMIEITSNDSERQNSITRFNQEADLLATINYPNVPQVYDRFSEGHRHYLAMEFISGMDLKELLEEYTKIYNNPLPEEHVAIYFMQLCLTLKYLHGNTPPILHRDIKPPNIILTKEGKIKLVDFGIAKAIRGNTQGTSIGTQGYAAPEQYKGLADARTDIYALGATIHHLLTGRDPQMEAPFDYPPIVDLNSKVSKDLSYVVSNMLQMNMESRPQSVEIIIGRLKVLYPDIEHKILNYPVENNGIIDIINNKLKAREEVTIKNLCVFCGHDNKPTSRFCIKCGKPLGSSVKLNPPTANDIPEKIMITNNSRILINYPQVYNEYIKIPDKDGNLILNVVLEKYFINGQEYFYITEKTSQIVGQEVYMYNIIRNAQGSIQYIRPVKDSDMKIKLYNHWMELL